MAAAKAVPVDDEDDGDFLLDGDDTHQASNRPK